MCIFESFLKTFLQSVKRLFYSGTKLLVLPFLRMKSKVEKLVQTNKEQQDPVLSLDDRSLSSLTDISRDFSQFTHITELVLAHNKLTKITQGLLSIELE